MKKRITMMMVGTLALGAMLLGLSCSPPAQNNTNAGPGNNAATINSNDSANSGSVATDDDPCTAPGIKKDNVEKKLDKDIKANAKLQKQFGKNSFRFKVFQGLEPDSLYLFVAGVIGGSDGLGALAGIVKTVGKKSCVERVFFVTSDALLLSDEAARTALSSGRFFEWWISCQDPNIPCLGECRPADQCPAPTPAANANSVTNVNKTPTPSSNSNSNSNSKAAVNGK